MKSTKIQGAVYSTIIHVDKTNLVYMYIDFEASYCTHFRIHVKLIIKNMDFKKIAQNSKSLDFYFFIAIIL